MDDIFSKNYPLTNSSKKKKTAVQSQNFIEAVRDMGGSIGGQVKNLGSDVARGAIDSLFGKAPSNQDNQNPNNYQTPQNPNQPFNFEEYLFNREKQIRQQERSFASRMRENEKVLYNRGDVETKKQIRCVQEEIVKIIKESKELATELIEAERTVSTTIVSAGTYHLNFFARVRNLLIIARKRLSESKSWLELFNSRQHRKGLYWNSVKKSGTKFMLSQERYMATQAG